MKLKETALLRAFTFLRIPLIYECSPSVIELNDKRCVVKFPLNRKTRNHLKSMYFGALCIGADCGGGLMAMRLIQKRGGKINMVFKDLKADFLKRAEGNVYFTCKDGLKIRKLIDKVEKTGERHNLPVKITATVSSKTGDELVAEFVLTLSLKLKTR